MLIDWRMTQKREYENKPQRLAKGLSKNKANARAGRTRKDPLRAQSGGHAGRTVANERNVSPLVRLMGAFRSEKIRFQLIGMSAAVVQGVPVVTHDVDLWLDLPVRQYMRPVNLALRLGAKMVRNTVVELSDGMLVNFIFEVTGLKSFAVEFRKARKLNFHGLMVPVMPLESIRRSKMAVMRPKDEAHIHYIAETLRLRKKTK
ncbi:MAG: hypothetical protein KGJ60_09670 [Verrucomicrobiota bacterium]|nr:hypothetical protein [Verrucomicrobiota bacterium]